MGPSMGGVLRPIQCCDGNWLATRSRDAVDRLVDVGRKKNHVSRPRSSPPVCRRSQAHGRATREIKPLKLLISKKADRFPVRRPERKLAALRARQGSCYCAVQGAQEQHPLPIFDSSEHEIAAIVRDGGCPCLVTQREKSH